MFKKFEYITRPSPIYAGVVIGVIIGATQSPIFNVASLNPRAVNAFVCGTILGLIFWLLR